MRNSYELGNKIENNFWNNSKQISFYIQMPRSNFRIAEIYLEQNYFQFRQYIIFVINVQ